MKQWRRTAAGLMACAMLMGCMTALPEFFEIHTMVHAADVTILDMGTEGDYTCEYLSDGSVILMGYNGEYNGGEEELTVPTTVNGYPVKYVRVCGLWYNVKYLYVPSGIGFVHAKGDIDIITEKEAAEDFAELGKMLNGWEIGRCGSNTTYCMTPDGELTFSGTGEVEYFNFKKQESFQKISTLIIEEGITSVYGSFYTAPNNLNEIIVSENNMAYSVLDGVLFNKEKTELLGYPSGRKDTEYIVPDGVQKIGDYVFLRSVNLTSINVPDSVYEIGYSALNGTKWLENQPDGIVYCGKVAYCCKGEMPDCDVVSLKEGTLGVSTQLIIDAYGPSLPKCTLEIPDTVVKIQQPVFTWGDGNLYPGGIRFDVDENNKFYTSVDGALYDKEMKTLLAYPVGNTEITDLVIPYGVTTWPEDWSGIFSYWTKLNSVSFPDTMSRIPSGSFSCCAGLEKITISANTTEIGYRAFADCDNLTDVYFKGTEEQWDAITIASQNDILASATIHFLTYTIADLDGSTTINASDAAILLTAAAAAGTGAETGLTDAQIAAADLNSDGAFDAKDAAIILQYAAYTGSGGTDSIEDFLASLNA